MSGKITTEKFIQRAREVHGDRYDYSKVDYKNAKTKVIIICKEHGEFEQNPNKHKLGRGCQKCGGTVKLTTNEVIGQLKLIHGDKYLYDKVEYKGNKENITIVCREHGDFRRTPSDLKQGQGCPTCSGRNLTTTQYIEQAVETHGDKYDYSKTTYKDSVTPIIIICKEHGEFRQAPSRHKGGSGCQKCGENYRLSQIEFINECRKTHGDKYGYENVKYVNLGKKITIMCKEHGEFRQLASNHRRGDGCPECGGSKKHTNEKFISKSRETHGGKYDYSKVDYKNAKTKVIIICKEHGEFEQEGHVHISGSGCPTCVGKNENTESCIEKFSEVHGDRYDYSEVIYRKNDNKIIIICKEHGEFEQTPNSHKSGGGCPECGGSKKQTTDIFIEKSFEVHGNKYDYSKVDYVRDTDKVTIICKEHGEFEQKPNKHKSGHGCPVCNSGVKTTEQFIDKVFGVHGNKYDYSEVVYISAKSKVDIICKEHGKFRQTPDIHYKGNGCPHCSSSRGENKILLFLNNNNIKYDFQKTFDGMVYISKLRCDFYLPDHNLVIEYNGRQHYKPVNYFGGEEGFLLTQERDKIKADYLKENNIDLLIIPYTEKNNIEKILEEKLFK